MGQKIFQAKVSKANKKQYFETKSLIKKNFLTWFVIYENYQKKVSILFKL